MTRIVAAAALLLGAAILFAGVLLGAALAAAPGEWDQT